jgi:uncharacterized protein
VPVTGSVALNVVATVLVVGGLVGVLVPVLPGLVLVLAGIGVWAVPRGDAVGWTVLGVAAAIVTLGTVLKYLLPGARMRAAGVPGRTLFAGGVLGIVGFFVIPVIGLLLGFVLGVYLAESARLGRDAAWPSTRTALGAVGWSILIELAAGLLATAVWVGALVVT